MNERIRKLMEQASSSACYDEPNKILLMNSEIERFAELLLTEAAEIASSFQYSNIQDRDVRNTILEHFEVE